MNFQDSGIIITKRLLQEQSSIISVFTQNNGLYSGVLKQYSKKAGDSLVAGNMVDFFWSARLHEHIGSVKCELISSYNHNIIASKTKLYAFNSIAEILQKAFCEREPHNKLFPYLLKFLQNMSQDFCFLDYINLELAILAETGHELQLSSCVVTGKQEDLTYVSPKSGCAVSQKAGEPYANKLLPLPSFLSKNEKLLIPDQTQMQQALNLTSYFLDRYILNQRLSLPARKAFIEHMLG